MKMLLNISGVLFIAPDATTAAKVADLIGTMQAVTQEYTHQQNAPSIYSLVNGGSRYNEHALSIESLDGKQRFASREEFETWEKFNTPAEEGGAQ